LALLPSEIHLAQHNENNTTCVEWLTTVLHYVALHHIYHLLYTDNPKSGQVFVDDTSGQIGWV